MLTTITADDWLNSGVDQVIRHQTHRARDRKLRLFAVACCQRVANFLVDERSRDAVRAAELYAEGAIGKVELRYARRAAGLAISRKLRPAEKYARQAALASTASQSWDAARNSAKCAMWAVSADSGRDMARDADAEYECQSKLIRDIFSNPFRPVAFDPTWRTESVLTAARTIYDEGSFADMSHLAHALVEAGCNNEEILSHCRLGGEHVRGCWLVDLVLQKP